ncbi:MAG: hypothetical protein EA384_00505, partial [Spirochaetaceae bacterium]
MRTPVLVLAALILVSFTLFAQSPTDTEPAGPGDATEWQPRPTLQRGAWYVGGYSGSSGFHGRGTVTPLGGSEVKFAVTGIGFSGMGGYFVADRFSLGPQIAVNYSREVDPADNVRSVVQWSLGGQAAYYHELPGTPWVPVARVVASFDRTVEKDDKEIRDSIENGYRLSPRVGAYYFFTNRLAAGA